MNDRLLIAWPQRLAHRAWSGRWYTLWSLVAAGAMTGSVWFVPSSQWGVFASDALIAQGSLTALFLLVSTVRSSRDGQPMARGNLWLPLKTALLSGSMLPVISSSVGPISVFQAFGVWLQHLR